MKKLLIVTLISCILVGLMSISVLAIKNISKPETNILHLDNNNQISIEKPYDQTYKSLFITLIYPFIEKAINDYYDEYFTVLP